MNGRQRLVVLGLFGTWMLFSVPLTLAGPTSGSQTGTPELGQILTQWMAQIQDWWGSSEPLQTEQPTISFENQGGSPDPLGLVGNGPQDEPTAFELEADPGNGPQQEQGGYPDPLG